MSYRPLTPTDPDGVPASTRSTTEPTGGRRRRWTTGALALLLAGGAVVGGHAMAQADEPVTSGASPTASAPAAPTDAGGSSVAGPLATPAPGQDGTRPTPPDPDAAHTPHLGGEVVSSDGSTIEITDHEGFLRTIHTNSSTTFDGVSNPVGVGTRIDAEGSVDSDKTSLLATVVRAAPTPPEPGSAPAGPAAGGPGGGSAPTPPSDAPAPPSDAPAPPSGGVTPPSATGGSGSSTAPSSSAAPTS